MNANTILESVLDRGDISAIEALVLIQEPDYMLPALIEAANTLNKRTNNNIVTYVKSKYIHYTNICRASCKFCSFYRKKGQRNTFTLSERSIIKTIKAANGIKEICLQGGLNPELSLNDHISLIRTIKEEFPNLHIQAYSPSEIYFIARQSKTTSFDALNKLKDAGLNSISGTATNILNDRIRKKFSPDILRTNDWIELIKTAHRLGITTTASMLFGHGGSEIHLCEHMDIIKTIQAETGGFTTFTPTPFIPNGTSIARNGSAKNSPSHNTIIKMFAIARLFYNKSIKNIQVDVTKLGMQNTIRGLTAGANDIAPIAFDQYTIKSQHLSKELPLSIHTIKNAIIRANKIPMERPPHSKVAAQLNARKTDEYSYASAI
ncbi:MAG: hypothetical protein A2W23_05180 [Planctomycetes bacterium RBG_16_43_13]|nr:MAG: hypothetical protein A2W23_05180 [Planctomycetes bacterium RBG_16_43_13]